MNQVATATALRTNVPLRYRIAAHLVLGSFGRWHGGALAVSLPDGTLREYGDRTVATPIGLTMQA